MLLLMMTLEWLWSVDVELVNEELVVGGVVC